MKKCSACGHMNDDSQMFCGRITENLTYIKKGMEEFGYSVE